jgi:hypothetical protein
LQRPQSRWQKIGSKSLPGFLGVHAANASPAVQSRPCGVERPVLPVMPWVMTLVFCLDVDATWCGFRPY